MATVTKPIALDESFHTTETPSRNIADVLASLGDAISQGAQPVTKKLATNSFKTINGGLVDGLTVQFTPVQDLHGYSKPWAGGAGKNKLAMTVAGIKSLNTSGTWSGNAYTLNGVTFTIQTDADNNVIGITVSGTNNVSSWTGFNVGRMSVSEGTSITANTNAITLSSTSVKGRIDGYNGDTYITGMDILNSDISYAVPSGMDNIRYTIYVYQNYTISSPVTVKPMIRLASVTDPTFEPYENKCPISGHTEAKSQINDTVYTTSLGTTVYGGEVEQVSGVGEVTKGLATSFSRGAIDSSGKLYKVATASAAVPISDGNVKPNIICNYFEPLSLTSARIGSPKCITQFGNDFFVGGYVGDEATLDSILTAMNVCYPLATPTTLTLTGQNITAEVGTNNVSAPLTGQEIKPDSVIYKDMFTWEDVLKVI